MTPPRIDAVLLRWPDRVAYTAVGYLSIPGCQAMLQVWTGETPWAALQGLFVQAFALDGARRLRALSFMTVPTRN